MSTIVDAHSHDWDSTPLGIEGWTAARTEDPKTPRSGETGIHAIVQHYSGTYWNINRGGLVFDTTGIASTVSVLSAILYINCGNKYSTASGSLVLANANAISLPADTHAFTALVGLTEITRKAYGDIDVGSYTAIPIPTAKLSIIQKGSYTHIGIYFSADFDDDDSVVPDDVDKTYGFAINAEEAASNPPYLVLTVRTAYPTEALTRITNLIHRFSPGNYTLEIALGEVTSDFGLPQYTAVPQPSVPKPPAVITTPPDIYHVEPLPAVITTPYEPEIYYPEPPTPYQPPVVPYWLQQYQFTREELEYGRQEYERWTGRTISLQEYAESIGEWEKLKRLQRLAKLTPGI